MPDVENLPMVISGLAPEDQALLALAVRRLESESLALRLAGVVGTSVEALKALLPKAVQRLVDGSVRYALSTALKAALRSQPSARSKLLSPRWMHRGLATASGMAGGALGVPGTLLELPVSTTLLLRQIAAVAAEHGEDLDEVETQTECLKVFAFGSQDPRDDEVDSGYYAVRLALSQMLQGATGRTVGQVLPSFLSAVASRFGVPVSVKISAQAAPLVGAAAGAAVNLAFLEHFRGVAEAHFTIRALERHYGPARVRAAYDAERVRQKPFG